MPIPRPVPWPQAELQSRTLLTGRTYRVALLTNDNGLCVKVGLCCNCTWGLRKGRKPLEDWKQRRGCSVPGTSPPAGAIGLCVQMGREQRWEYSGWEEQNNVVACLYALPNHYLADLTFQLASRRRCPSATARHA